MGSPERMIEVLADQYPQKNIKNGKMTVYINPELSPELVAWARSKALDLVEIDEMKLSEVHDEYACRFLDIADIKSIYKANPLKLKTPTGGKGIND